jgi:transcriptional/translational regulatory protein YebC/TACO1
VVILPKGPSEDELMLLVLEAGAEDLIDDGDTWRVTTPPASLAAVRAALDADGMAYDSADVTMQPTSTVALGTAEEAKKVLRLLDSLDEHDDVQAVHANFDIPDDILQTVEA